MASIILEKDHFLRNCIIFIIALIASLSLGTFYFFSNRGCIEYAAKLENCTPFTCTQRVFGFESKYMGHTAINLSRQIIGPETDQFFNKSTCNIIEIDDTEKNEKIFCKYTDANHKIAVTRAAILFGNEPPPPEGKELTGMETKALRASHAKRTAQQETECKPEEKASKVEVIDEGFAEMP